MWMEILMTLYLSKNRCTLSHYQGVSKRKLEYWSDGKMEMRTLFGSGSSINKPPFFKGGYGLPAIASLLGQARRAGGILH